MTNDTNPARGDHHTDPAPIDDADGTEKPGGLGEDGTIPADPNGIAAGHTDTPSHFNPEEDEEASDE